MIIDSYVQELFKGIDVANCLCIYPHNKRIICWKPPRKLIVLMEDISGVSGYRVRVNLVKNNVFDKTR